MAKVKVRIAVSVDSDGKWCAAGDSVPGDARVMSYAKFGHSDKATGYWLEAELDIPTERTFIPKVIPA